MTIFCILQQQSHDYSTLNKFGEVDLLFPLGLNMTNTRIIADSAQKWLANFDFANDYFLPTGNPIVVAIVSMVLRAIAIETHEEEVVILEWDKYSLSFVPKPYTFK